MGHFAEKNQTLTNENQVLYDRFAQVYDEVMDHVPYSSWARYLRERYDSFCEKEPKTLLDAGCGSGLVLVHMQRRKMRIIGLDRSKSMLARARRRLPNAEFFCADLKGPFQHKLAPVDWMISTHNCLNYLADEGELAGHFQHMAKIASPGALYSLDVTSESNILENFHDRTFRYKAQGSVLVWENYYDRKARNLVSILHLESGKDSWSETHMQRYYPIETIEAVAAKANFQVLMREGEYTKRKPRKKDTLINIHLKYLGT